MVGHEFDEVVAARDVSVERHRTRADLGGDPPHGGGLQPFGVGDRLDPRGRGEIWDSVRELVAEGTTVLLTTQYLDEADHLADDIAVIDHGRVIATGTPDELKSTIGDRLDVTVEDPTGLRPAATVLNALAGTEPSVEGAGQLSVALPGGGFRLADIVRELDRAGVAAADVRLRRPTLDEVFLRLTDRKEHVR
ncbi:hypothetical protein GCM10009575_024900 [Streptomyces rhizosphaericus]|uniref:DUF4162 domain-containing protein n=1 Tax=Streptomyces rhizosphaericus TaxID=114699 RepID=A0ABN1PC18_9ACTN